MSPRRDSRSRARPTAFDAETDTFTVDLRDALARLDTARGGTDNARGGTR